MITSHKRDLKLARHKHRDIITWNGVLKEILHQNVVVNSMIRFYSYKIKLTPNCFVLFCFTCILVFNKPINKLIKKYILLFREYHVTNKKTSSDSGTPIKKHQTHHTIKPCNLKKS